MYLMSIHIDCKKKELNKWAGNWDDREGGEQANLAIRRAT